jgi:hypothetical protein
MRSRAVHKTLVWGVALAAAAVITGVAATLESSVPRGSVWALLARIAAVAFVGPPVIAGFLAVCERLDRSLGVSDEEEPGRGNDPETTAPARWLPAKGGRGVLHGSDDRLKCLNAGIGPPVLPPLRAQAHCTPPRPVRTRTWVGQ